MHFIMINYKLLFIIINKLKIVKRTKNVGSILVLKYNLLVLFSLTF